MPIIVQILHSTPLMNTPSQKKLAQQNPMNPQFGQGDINSQQYFFTLPNTINDNLFVHLVQQNTPLFNLQDLDHEDLANHKRAKRNIVRTRKLQRSTERAEKLVQLKRELIRKAELRVSGLVWRNQERREKGVKRIKKEEPSSPVIKLETPPTPSLQYPLTNIHVTIPFHRSKRVCMVTYIQTIPHLIELYSQNAYSGIWHLLV